MKEELRPIPQIRNSKVWYKKSNINKTIDRIFTLFRAAFFIRIRININSIIANSNEMEPLRFNINHKKVLLVLIENIYKDL